MGAELRGSLRRTSNCRQGRGDGGSGAFDERPQRLRVLCGSVQNLGSNLSVIKVSIERGRFIEVLEQWLRSAVFVLVPGAAIYEPLPQPAA